MSELVYVCVGLAGLNVLLAAGLLTVYARNVREVRSAYTLGLALFAGLVLAYNATQVYHLVTMMPAFADVGEELMVLEAGLQTGALVALTTVTLR